MISIINYGLGNLGAISNLLKRLNAECNIISSPKNLDNSTAIIIPGVGSFDKGMENLAKGNWIEPIKYHALERKTWTLGICLGMQLLGESSEEGRKQGLGLIKARTVRFKTPPSNSRFRIPHMGWCNIKTTTKTPLFEHNTDTESPRFYFVHSYHVVPESSGIILATAKHSEEFVAVIQADNLLGVQFHPEKSHKYGFAFFNNFIKLVYGNSICQNYSHTSNRL